MVNLDKRAAGDKSICINGVYIFFYGELIKKYFFYALFIYGTIQCMNGGKEAT
jgi:hypothetical protein